MKNGLNTINSNNDNNTINIEFYTKEDIQKILHIGRDKTNKLLNLKGFPSITIGKSKLIPKAQFNKWVQENIGTEIIL